jgi:putative addiction module antidote
MTQLTMTQIGNSVGAIFPKELLAKLRIDKGDTLYVTETPDGITLRPYDDEFAKVMDVAEKVMREHRDVLKKLAE